MMRYTFVKTFKFLLLIGAAVALGACGGGSGGGSSQSVEASTAAEKTAPLLVAMTDAEGDFLTYVVDVTSITFSRENGADVNVLPISTTIDFAQYVEVSELLTMADVPVGRYDSAAITLDFSEAQITVQSASGDPIVASVVDENGDSISEITAEIQLENRDGFHLRLGLASQLTLDFDLDASNEIEIAGDAATVTVTPVLIADTLLAEQKAMRLRGLLQEVSVDDSTFELAVRPFRSRRQNHNGFGDAMVGVTEDTTYEINGEAVASESGLAALAELEAGTSVVTMGTWDFDERAYVADQVLAGSSVPWDQADIVKGTVVARVDNVLTVRGGIVELAEGEFSFNDNITVTLSENTKIRAAQDRRHRHHRGRVDVTLADISVGSRIAAMGEYDEAGAMDAAEGNVRIYHSSVTGSVVSVSPLALDLTTINGRQIDIFDFAGTGTSSDADANPDFYELLTGSLRLDSIELNDAVRAKGFVSSFGAAPEDFNATTLIDNSGVKTHLKLAWGQEGSASAVENASEQGILLDVSETDHRHIMRQASFVTDLQSLEAMPLVVPGEGEGVYAISQNLETEVYTNFSGFVVALNTALEAGELVSKFYADGYYDAVENTFTSSKIRLKLASLADDTETQ